MFRDRADAGRRLAEAVAELDLTDPLVLALPRGGVPVAAEVAGRIGGTLDVYVVRKVGAPGHAELGIGAVAEGGTVVADRATLVAMGLDDERFGALVERELVELRRRVAVYRGDRALPAVRGRDVVVVDDGLATGVTAEAALVDLRPSAPRLLVLAVPVGARDTAERLAGVADRLVVVETPRSFGAVGRWYDRFDATSDDEVLAVLGRAHAHH